MPFSEWSHLFTSKGSGGGVVGCADPAARSRILERMFETARELDWLGKLNEQQREAATAPSERPLLILAGAGSGKTATLSARVAWLIAQRLPPERILLLTFTRRAAAEMLARTRALLELRLRGRFPRASSAP
jgi:UvrD/REP helicase N-terminal domain